MVVLFIAGNHVPVIALFDVVGKVILPPEQMAATCVNVGVVSGFTVIVIVVVVAHVGAAVEVGVNV